jgi:hypothetical protein
MSFLLRHTPYVELPPRVRTPEIVSRDEGCPGRVAGQIAKCMGLLAKISKVKKIQRAYRIHNKPFRSMI